MATSSKVKKTDTLEAKASIKERRALEAQRRQRNQQIVLTVVAVALLVGVIAVVLISTRPAEAYIPPASLTRYADLEKQGYQGVTSDGFAFLGKPDAPVTVEEVMNFSCPHCLDYHDNTFLNILDEIKAGRVKYVEIPLIAVIDFDPKVATQIALCAAAQGKYWEMQDVLFDWQSRYGQTAGDQSRLLSAAGALGMDTGKISSCMNSDAINKTIQQAETTASQRNVPGTPTVYLNGQQITPAVNGAQEPDINALRGLIEAKSAAKAS